MKGQGLVEYSLVIVLVALVVIVLLVIFGGALTEYLQGALAQIMEVGT